MWACTISFPWFQYQQTKEARDKAVIALQGKVQERNSKAQQETATRLEQARASIARDIPEWSPELAGKLNAFAIERGFTADELRPSDGPAHRQTHSRRIQANYNNLLLGMIPKPQASPVQLFPYGLPPATATWLLFQRLRNNGSAAAQNQPAAPLEASKVTQPAPTPPMSGVDTGWSVDRVQ